MSRTSNGSGSEERGREVLAVQESGSPHAGNHIDVLVQQYFHELQSSTSPLPQSQYVPTGIFYHLHPPSCHRSSHDDFISLRRHNNVIHYSNCTRHPRTSPSEIVLPESEDEFALSDLPVDLLGSYDAGPEGWERSVGVQRFNNLPQTSLVEPVAGRRNLRYDEYTVNPSDHDSQTLCKRRTTDTDKCESVNCLSRGDDESEMSSCTSCSTETTYLSSAEEQFDVLLVTSLPDMPQGAIESTSGYMTAPLTAEGLGEAALHPEQMELFQTLQKQDKNEPVEHSLLPVYQQPEHPPLACEGRAWVTPGHYLVRHLYERREEQVEHEEKEEEPQNDVGEEEQDDVLVEERVDVWDEEEGC